MDADVAPSRVGHRRDDHVARRRRDARAGRRGLAVTERDVAGRRPRRPRDRRWRPRLTAPHPRIDALRDTLAIERGPLVYCLETADLPADVVLEDIRIAPDTTLADEDRSELAGGVVGVSAAGVARPAGQGLDPAATPVRLRAIPYHLWANREPAGMRVWIPRDRGATGEGG